MHRAERGQGFVHELLYDGPVGDDAGAAPHLSGLIDPASLLTGHAYDARRSGDIAARSGRAGDPSDQGRNVVGGYSADTVRGQRVSLRRFIVWCDWRGLSEPGEITGQILERYQRHLFAYRKPNGAPLTLGTQFGCLSPLRSWFKRLLREGAIPVDPAAGLILPRLPKHLPRALLGIAETEAMLAAADPATPQGLRDRAMLELL